MSSLTATYETTLAGGGKRRDDETGSLIMKALKQSVDEIDPSSFNSDPTLLGLVVRAATDLVDALRVRWSSLPLH